MGAPLLWLGASPVAACNVLLILGLVGVGPPRVELAAIVQQPNLPTEFADPDDNGIGAPAVLCTDYSVSDSATCIRATAIQLRPAI